MSDERDTGCYGSSDSDYINSGFKDHGYKVCVTQATTMLGDTDVFLTAIGSTVATVLGYRGVFFTTTEGAVSAISK